MNQIRIGTMAGKGRQTAKYIADILPHGFESFQINFWQQLGDVELAPLAREVQAVFEGSDAVVSTLAIFGNPLGTTAMDLATLDGWKQCIDHAQDFGCDLVTGFTGRLPGESIPDSIPRFKEVFGDLSARAADRGVRIAFENCSMGGNWDTGEWNIAHSPRAWELMFAALPADNIGLEWEPCHQQLLFIEPLPQLRKWAGKVFHVHGKDATIHRDVIREHGIHGGLPYADHRTPGFGESNWTDIISELRRAGYAGTIDIEGWHDPIYLEELEMTGQVHALRYLKQCRGGDFTPNP